MAANLSMWIVDSDISGPLDPALGRGPAHEESFLGLGHAVGLGPLGALGPGSIGIPGLWPSTRGEESNIQRFSFQRSTFRFQLDRDR